MTTAGAKIKYGHEGLELVYSETGEEGPHGVTAEGLEANNVENSAIENSRTAKKHSSTGVAQGGGS